MSKSDVDGEGTVAQPAASPAELAPSLSAPEVSHDAIAGAGPVSGEHAAPREATVTTTEREVTIQRSVRTGRILIAGIVIGALLAMLVSALFPLAEDAEYTLAQIVGFMALIGGAIGLALAGVLSLILGAVASRRSGRGIAIQSDVQ